MRYVIGFFTFWYDFIVGDDWTIAAVVVITLAIIHQLAARGMAVSWLLPAAVLVFLGVSLWRASRPSQ